MSTNTEKDPPADDRADGFPPKVRCGDLEVDPALARMIGLVDEHGRVVPEELRPQQPPPEEPGAQESAQGEPNCLTPSQVAFVPVDLPPPRPRRAGKVIGLVVAGLVVLWAVEFRVLWSRKAEPQIVSPIVSSPVRRTTELPPRRAPRLPVTVRTDPSGAAVAISGPDPERVLVAFCSQGEHEGRYRPLGVSPSSPPQHGSMLGVFEDILDAPRRLAIRLYLDPRSGRWLAGDGSTPIDPVDSGLSSSLRELEPSHPPLIELIVQPVAALVPREP